MVDSLKGIDDSRAFDVTIVIFIRVFDPKTPFLEHLTLWRSPGSFPREDRYEISLRVDFLDGSVDWKVI